MSIDTFFWWLGAVTATCIAGSIAAFALLLAREIFFTGLFVKTQDANGILSERGGNVPERAFANVVGAAERVDDL